MSQRVEFKSPFAFKKIRVTSIKSIKILDKAWRNFNSGNCKKINKGKTKQLNSYKSALTCFSSRMAFAFCLSWGKKLIRESGVIWEFTSICSVLVSELINNRQRRLKIYYFFCYLFCRFCFVVWNQPNLICCFF